MNAQLTCPHCRMVLTLNGPVAAGSKVQCLACRHFFVSPPHTKLGSSTIVNAAHIAGPSQVPIVRAGAGGETSRRGPTRYRDEDEERAPRDGNKAIIGVMLGLIGLLLAVGVVLVLYCFTNNANEPADKTDALAQLPDNTLPQIPKDAPPVPPTEVNKDPQEQVEVTKPPVDPPPVKVEGPRPTLTPDVQKQIDQAIDRGVLYLKATQLPSGIWMGTGNHMVGYTALPALTLLECGVPKEDMHIQLAARAVRIGSAQLKKTYELALAVLFLDKLGDPKDEKLIQALAMRLVAGQSYAGGWSYESSLMTTPTSQELLTFLQKERKYKLDYLIGKNELANPLRLSEVDLSRKPLNGPEDGLRNSLKSDTSLETPIRGPARSPPNPLPGDPPADRGNGLIPGLPGGKGGQKIPGDGPAQKEDPGAKKDQSAPVKDKGANPKGKGPVKTAKPPSVPASVRPLPIFNPIAAGPTFKNLAKLGDHSNTQFALLGLWAARRHGIPLERTFALAELRFRRLQNPDGGWGYVGEHRDMGTRNTMTCVGLLGLAVGRGTEYELLHLDQTMQGSAVKKLTTQDERIQHGPKSLGTAIGEPRGRTSELPMQNLYLLWSIERVAVLYNLKTIGDKDWYLWGAEILLANQHETGCWTNGGYHQAHPIIDTCFALLFLKRANLAPDLSDNLRLYIPVVDPDRRGSSRDN